jgi:hypothetical protein
MPSFVAGRSRKRRSAPASPGPTLSGQATAPLTTVRVAVASPPTPRSSGRRDVDFAFDRMFIPSLVADHTELVLRQAGVQGHEGFAIWAGTLAGGDAHVGTLVVPRASSGPGHGEISRETTGRVLNALDERDLVPMAQLHTHPRRAYLSPTDAIRPLVAAPGFLSIVIPDFGFVDLADVGLWSAHQYLGPGRWRELDGSERSRRFIIDDSVIRVD